MSKLYSGRGVTASGTKTRGIGDIVGVGSEVRDSSGVSASVSETFAVPETVGVLLSMSVALGPGDRVSDTTGVGDTRGVSVLLTVRDRVCEGRGVSVFGRVSAGVRVAGCVRVRVGVGDCVSDIRKLSVRVAGRDCETVRVTLGVRVIVLVREGDWLRVAVCASDGSGVIVGVTGSVPVGRTVGARMVTTSVWLGDPKMPSRPTEKNLKVAGPRGRSNDERETVCVNGAQVSIPEAIRMRTGGETRISTKTSRTSSVMGLWA
jgi:hypothetical protein